MKSRIIAGFAVLSALASMSVADEGFFVCRRPVVRAAVTQAATDYRVSERSIRVEQTIRSNESVSIHNAARFVVTLDVLPELQVDYHVVGVRSLDGNSCGAIQVLRSKD